MSTPSIRRIVVIDDNQDLADLFGSLCDALGYQVYVAYSGVDGLNFVKDIAPQVVFCDINMPGMDGLELARTVRKDYNNPRPLLVAVTAWSCADTTRQVFTAGFDVHLTKPADFQAVAHMLAAYFASGTHTHER